MRKIIIFLLVLFFCYGAIGQAVTNRSSQTVTVQDARWMAQFNMFAPRVADTVAANFSKGIDSCGAIIFTYTDNGIWYRGCSPKRWLRMGSGQVINDTIFTEIPIAIKKDSLGHQIIYFLKERGLISGGIVTLDSCMTLGLNPTVVNIGYKQYSIPVQSGLVVPPADPSNGRIDLIVIDTNLNFIDIPGTPSATPIAPPYDIFSQFVLTQITVPQAATCLMIGQEIIYDENKTTEWVVTTNGNIAIDTANTAAPYHLRKAIYVSQYHNGSSIIFTKGSTDTVTAGEIIKMFPYFNGAFPNQMSGQWYHGSTSVSNSISLNQFFNPNDSNRYLNLSAQLSSWIFSSPIFDKFIITFGGSDTTLTKGLYLDYIQLQKGISNIVTGDFVDSVKTSGDSLFYYKQGLAIYGGAVGGGSGGGGINIYNTDSLLKDNRTVGLNSNSLSLTDAGTGTNFVIRPSDGAMEFTSPLGKQLRVSDDANELQLFYDTNSHLEMMSGKSTLTGNLLLNTVPSGSVTDSILTINTSTGQVNRVDPAVVGNDLQQAYDKNPLASPQIDFRGNDILFNNAATFETVTTGSASGQGDFGFGDYYSFMGLTSDTTTTDITSLLSGNTTNVTLTSSVTNTGTGVRGQFINIFPQYIKFGGSVGSNIKSKVVFQKTDTLLTAPSYVYVPDNDTLKVYPFPSGGGGSTNSNIGSGFRLAVPNTNNIKTLFNGYAIGIDSSSNTNALTLKADSNLLLTKLRAISLYQPIGTYVTSVSGTSNRITSTGGTTPVIDISASYAGQSSITTLGTVTTGTLSTGAIIGGVTMTLGSDAQGDIYYRNGSGILTRLATGTAKQNLHPDGSGGYSWKDSTVASTGTVTSVATGLGLSGGTITTTGTLLVDTSSASILSRQRAANTYWGLAGNTGVNLPDTSTRWLGTTNNTPLRFKTNGTGRMIIDSIGNVGIGTLVPSYKLHVFGSIVAQGAASNGDFAIRTNDGTTGFWDFSTTQSAGTYTAGSFQLLDAISSKFPVIIEKNAPSNSFFIKATSGNIGLGTISPTARLHLPAGTATANTAPLKFTLASSALTSVAEIGAFEPVSNRINYTDSTGTRYIIHAGGTPTIAAGVGAGTSPTISITGIDEDGYISVTTGTLPTLSGTVATITFSSAYGVTPKCVILNPANSNASLLSGVTMVFVDQAGISTTTWAITAGTTALTAATTYKFYYHVRQ